MMGRRTVNYKGFDWEGPPFHPRREGGSACAVLCGTAISIVHPETLCVLERPFSGDKYGRHPPPPRLRDWTHHSLVMMADMLSPFSRCPSARLSMTSGYKHPCFVSHAFTPGRFDAATAPPLYSLSHSGPTVAAIRPEPPPKSSSASALYTQGASSSYALALKGVGVHALGPNQARAGPLTPPVRVKLSLFVLGEMYLYSVQSSHRRYSTLPTSRCSCSFLADSLTFESHVSGCSLTLAYHCILGLASMNQGTDPPSKEVVCRAGKQCDAWCPLTHPHDRQALQAHASI